eukprot:g5081.t1
MSASDKSTESEVLKMPTPEQIIQEDVMNNCFLRTVMSGVMGGGLGIVFGLFTSSLEGATGPMAVEANSIETRRARDVFFEMVKNTRQKSWSYAKAFAAMGALFAGSECVIEKHRAKHDTYNTVYAGCFTGGVLGYSGGPKMMCFGCVSFAAFSVVIDRFFDH